MITIVTRKADYTGYKETEFANAFSASRFIFKMISEGYLVTDWVCDDPEDNETLQEAVRTAKKGGRR